MRYRGLRRVAIELTAEQRDIVEGAAVLARECLEPRAARYDKTASHPVESWHDLWKHGYLAAAVPKEYGGMGLDMLTYVMTVERLAWGCTSTAMTTHMHSVVQRYIDALCTPEQKTRFYADVVEGGKLFGSWGSEPERRGGTGIRDTSLTPVSGGFVVNGVKHFCTMAVVAHRYMVHCTMDGYEPDDGYVLALVPNDALGLEVTGGWDTLGMRGTVSPGVEFKDCFVAEGDVLGQPGRAIKIGVGQGFGLGYAAIYVGAGQRAVDFVTDYVKARRFAPDPHPLSHSILVQRAVAEMSMSLEAARQVLYRSAESWADADPQGRWVLAARAKHLAMESALMVTAKALQTVGGRSAHKSFPLERLFRDVRTSTLMPPNADMALEIIGKALLGVEEGLQA